MGPLAGVKVVEFAGIGPGPFCAMLLADMGAEVVRVDRPVRPLRGGAAGGALLGMLPPEKDVLNRSRRSVALDLKKPEAVAAALALVARADALIEGFRPGVMERLGLGPEPCLARNPRLVYGRITGWGQHGPLSQAAGHDINYIAIGGALGAIGASGGAPVPPLNLVGDFGGGAWPLAFGLVCGILEARTSGRGQVVDAAMTDGTALLLAMACSLRAAGLWSRPRGENLLDGGAPYYGTYQCADGKWLAVGPLEPQFHALLLERCGVTDPELQAQGDQPSWPERRQKMAALFRTRTQQAWCTLLEGTDACVSPVLDLDEAAAHPHNAARATFIEVDGVTQPAPAPRFSRTAADRPTPPRPPGADGEAVLADWGLSAAEVAALRAGGALG